MKTQIVYRQNGDIQGITFDDSQAVTGEGISVLFVDDLNIGFGKLFADQSEFFRCGYIDNGEIKRRPEQPTHAHTWDNEKKEWVPNLDMLRIVQWNKIKQDRNIQEQGGFVHKGHVFQSDYASQFKITLNKDSGPMEWTDVNNESVLVVSSELAESLRMHLAWCHEHSQVLRGMIYAATTAEEIVAVAW